MRGTAASRVVPAEEDKESSHDKKPFDSVQPSSGNALGDIYVQPGRRVPR
jgi:hypothetical protein